MNLILWRHAEAEDGEPDLNRDLTSRGRKQAARIGHWLKDRLPSRHAVLCSPAARTVQTAEALGAKYTIDRRLLPTADVADYLAAAGWPEGPDEAGGTVVLVGHQPIIGRLASLLLAGTEQNWSVRKGAVWWLSTREREGNGQIVLRAVVHPEMF